MVRDENSFLFDIITGKIMKDIITERKNRSADIVFFISKDGNEKGFSFATFGTTQYKQIDTYESVYLNAPKDASFGAYAYAYAVLKYR